MAEAGDDFTLVERGMVPAAANAANETLQRQRQKVLSWLDPTDYLSPGNEYMKHLHAYLPGTAKWVQESPIFRSWRSQDTSGDPGADTDSGYHQIAPASAHGASCLHVRGVARSGKSVFSASTIDQLQSAGNTVLFFFFRQIVEKNHAAKYLARDFAAQLLPHSDALVKQLAELSQLDSVESVGIDALWSVIFKTLVEGSVKQQVFCIVDALDEMDDADFPIMMERLIALGSANPEAVKVMFTGRPLPKIEQALHGKAVFQLKLDPVLLSPDVARYIDARMASLEPRLSDDRSELVRQAICERASGLFLHARLVTDNLAQGLQEGHITDETLPNSLDQLPRSLRQVYEEMLKEHAHRSGVSADHQAKILTCVTHSNRPLRLIELGSLVAQMLNVDLRRGKELVRASCGRLLELLEDETVSVIHHSFTEFLHDSRRSEAPGAFPVLENSQAHDMLAALCLEYLSTCPHFDMSAYETCERDYEEYDYDDSERNARVERRTHLRLSHPLVAYATENLGFHFQKSGIETDSRGLAALDVYFLPKNAAFETWALLKWHDNLTSSINAMHLLIDTVIPLFVLRHIVKVNPLLLHSQDPHVSTPLILAATVGRVDIVEFLLSKGADPIATRSDGYTVLHCAVKSDKADVVEHLLRAGIDPLIKTAPVYKVWDKYRRGNVHYDEAEAQKNRKTAFSMAISGRNSNIALQFIPFMPAEETVKCFHQAETPEVLDAILNTGLIDINSCPPFQDYHCFDEYKHTKLYAAVLWKKLDMAKVLLKHGADPMKRQPGQPTVLHAFAGLPYRNVSLWLESEAEDAYDLVQALVDAGADIEAPMDRGAGGAGDGHTPLHLAVGREKEFLRLGMGAYVVCNALLKAGADPNAATESGSTPLHLIKPGRTVLIELLANNGADIDRRNSFGQSPFLSLVNKLAYESDTDDNAEDIVASLHKFLDLGADPCATDCEGNNVFHCLMRNIEALDPNKLNKKGNAPIFCYAGSSSSPSRRRNSADNVQSDEILELLVRSGMRLDIQNQANEPVLHFLLTQHWTKIQHFESLFQVGADPNILGADGKSLFQKALRWSPSLEWLEYLLQVNSSPFSVDDKGNTIVHELVSQVDASYQVEAALDLVVAAGADPVAKNHQGQSALHVASERHAKVVFQSPHFQSLDVNERDVDGITPLHNFVRSRENFYRDLLQKGAREGKAELVHFLLSQYRSKDALLQDINSLGGGLPPLHLACRAGSADTVSVLLRGGADAPLVDADGFTPLHRLCQPSFHRSLRLQGRTEPVEATPLDLSVLSKRWEVVRELLACGARAQDQHYSSSMFILGTDKDKALAVAREMKKKLDDELSLLSEADLAKKKRNWYSCLAPTRWAAVGPLPDDPMFWILGPETFSDLPKSDQGNVTEFDIFRQAIQGLDFDTIKDYYDQGGNLPNISSRHPDALQYLVQIRLQHLLKYFIDGVRRYNKKKTVTYNKMAVTLDVTLLGVACANKAPSMDIVEWLVDEIGVNIDARHAHRSSGAETPLHILARGQSSWHLEAMRYLLAKGANVEARTPDGLTPLLVALNQNRVPGPWNVEAARILVAHGADANARTERQPGDWDWLESQACAVNTFAMDLVKEPEAVALLLSAGVDRTRSRGTLPRIVRMWMLPDAAKVLLDAGWDPNEEPHNKTAHHEYIDHFDEARFDGSHSHFNCRYALQEAARPPTHSNSLKNWRARQVRMTELLLSRGADPYATYPDGSFVLQRILEDRGQFMACVSSLKAENVDRKGAGGRTLLIQACKPTPAICQRKKYSRSSTDQPTPIIVADAIQALLDMGADVTLKDDRGRTALHWLCTHTRPLDDAEREAFKALVARDLSTIQAVDNDGRLPIHLALEAFSCEHRSLDFVIRHLMASGADVDMPDPTDGASSLHRLARSLVGNEKEDSVEARALFQDLLKLVDINAVNNAGESVTAAAIGAPFPETARHYRSGYPKGTESVYADALQFVLSLGAPEVDMITKLFEALMDLGVDPHRENNELRTPIDIAVARNYPGVVKLFSEEGKRAAEARCGSAQT
ncbi:hypothetical protein PWT90_05981 [Aphanocladium album]|nr:hypothetical protein PWT90_05981 [Aphanocladium album]